MRATAPRCAGADRDRWRISGTTDDGGKSSRFPPWPHVWFQLPSETPLSICGALRRRHPAAGRLHVVTWRTASRRRGDRQASGRPGRKALTGDVDWYRHRRTSPHGMTHPENESSEFRRKAQVQSPFDDAMILAAAPPLDRRY
jgi:hypothetical protein